MRRVLCVIIAPAVLRKSFDLFLTPVVYKLIGWIINECSRVQYRMIKKTLLAQTLKNQFPNYFSLDSLIKRTLTPLAWLGWEFASFRFFLPRPQPPCHPCANRISLALKPQDPSAFLEHAPKDILFQGLLPPSSALVPVGPFSADQLENGAHCN